MNVHFPGFDSGGGFIATVVAMVIIVIGMLGFFRWKKWL
jgi:Mg2+ and Co2+ transporter CorA